MFTEFHPFALSTLEIQSFLVFIPSQLRNCLMSNSGWRVVKIGFMKTALRYFSQKHFKKFLCQVTFQ